MKREEAETIALQALAFLAKDEDLLEHFFALTGLTPEELKTRIHEPDLLGGVLDQILSNDTVLLHFCNAASLSPSTILLARRALPGGYTIE